MKSKWLTHLEGKESLWIRIPGFIVGVIFIVFMPVMAWLEQASILSAIAAVFIGVLFVSYGFGGSKLLLKVLPSTYVKKL
jgi:hypothetical protein